jgi:oligopeptidase B
MSQPPQPLSPPPQAARRPTVLEAHGDRRTDDWYWLRDKEDPEVIAHLEAENAYTDEAFAPTAELQERLFQGIRRRVAETDVSAPHWHGGWWYWSRTVEGLQYPTHLRREDPEHRLSASEVLAAARAALPGAGIPGGADLDDPPLATLDQTEGAGGAAHGGRVVLDENALAGESDYFSLGVLDVSPDHRIVAYATDLDGSERHRLHFRVIDTGEDLADVVEDVSYGSAWSADSSTLFYVRPDEAMRPYQVWRHRLGTPASDDVLVYEDLDERYFVSTGLTRSERFILVFSESKMTTEARYVDATTPDVALEIVLPRRQGVEYDVEHAIHPERGDVWLVRTNEGPDGVRYDNFAVLEIPVGAHDLTDARTFLPHRPEIKLDSVDAFARHVVVAERADGLEQLRVVRLADAAEHVIDQPEPVFSLTGGANPVWDTTLVRFGYSSLVTPPLSVDYDMESRERTVVRQTPIGGGYQPEDYRTERIWAEAADGAKVPISLVCRRDQPLDGSAPCLLYGYGSYELTIDPSFSALRLNLLERGFVFAIAHVRGGGELGRPWYEQGRLMFKRNTFTDFIACAEALLDQGWAARGRLVVRGGSAGGLLIGAVVNMRPDLFRAAVAEVPFVDVVTTMSDESLPLTVTEWEEWGNPRDDAEAYAYMLSYSPYDNVAATDYPALYVTAGINDPRVGYWEPAKWVCKLRATKTDANPVLFRCEMGAGHQGPSGRYDTWHDEARVQAFILTSAGIEV